MKTNFKRFMAMVLAFLMVFGTFSTMATAIDQGTHTHSWVEYGENPVVNPTCTERGYTWIICEDSSCNMLDIKDIKPATGHDYQIEYVAPDCHNDGKLIEKCANCGDVLRNEVLTANDNTIVDFDRNGDGDVTTEAGCKEHGYGHRFEWVQVNDAKCGERAEYWLMCTIEAENGNRLPDGRIVCGFNYFGRESSGAVGEGVIEEVKPHNFTKYDNAKLAKEPTCSEFGILIVECTNGCGKTTEVKVAKLPHDLEKHDGQAPTCDAAGWYAYETCKNCDYTTYTEIPATDHEYAAVVTAPTCTEKGYTTFTCIHDGCDDFYVDNYKPANGHVKRVEITKEPTCTEYGVETWYCWSCPEIIGGRDLLPNGHEWSDWSYTDGNCQTEASATRTCSVCKETETKTFEKGDHVKPAAEFISETVVKSENREDSYCAILYTCVICKNAVTEKADHRDMTYGEIQKHPTCTEEGVKADYCGACGYYKATFTDPTGHNHVETVVAPTCTEQGYSTFKCGNVDLNTGKVCGDELEKGNFVAALGHNKGYFSFIKPATCTEDAVVEMKCTRDGCGYVYSRAEIEAYCDSLRPIINFVLDAFGHTPEEDDGDCTTSVLCATCDAIITPAKAQHTPNTNSTNCDVEVSCTECGKVLRAATKHTPGSAATCKADQICTTCGVVLVEKSPNFHPQDDTVSGIAITRWPTCTEGAAGTLFCHLCATQDQDLDWETMTEEERNSFAPWIIELLKPEGHNLVSVGAKVPTCQVTGHDAYEYCTKCDYTTYVEKAVDPDNHFALGYHTAAVRKTYNGVEMGWARTPSCYADGLVWYYCDDCAAADTTGTYNGWTETVVGSIMDCHKDIATYGTELPEMEIASTCSVAGKKFYKCTHVYDTCDVIKVVQNGVVVGYDYRISSYTCDQIVSVDQPLAAHTFGIVNGITYATCTAGAAVDAKCLYCDYNFTVAEFNRYTGLNLSVNALGHSYEAVVIAPTCDEDGYTLHTCSACGDSYTDTPVDALGHKYTGVVTDPTCTQIGFTTYTCSVCGDGYIDDEVDALGHSYVSTVVAPNCTEAGYTDHTCSVCGEFYHDNEVAALGHDEVVIVRDSTCTLEGSKLVYCQREGCRYSEITVIDPKGHDYVDHEGQAATCTEPGWKAYQTCTRCDYTTYEVIASTGHIPYEWNWAHVCTDEKHCYNPTCTENGRGVGRLCSVCGECVNEIGVDHAVIPSFGKDHNYVVFVETADCTTIGFTYTICVWCGEGHGIANNDYADGKIWVEGVAVEGVITDYKPATGHDMQPVDKELGGNGDYGYKAPTCTDPGWEAQYCANGCGHTENKVEIPATGHSADNHKNAAGEFLPCEVPCVNGCGTMLSGHRDAEGNDMFEYRDEVKYESVKDENGAAKCKVTTYQIAYCHECQYKAVWNIIITLEDHVMVSDKEYNEANKGDDITDGKTREYCSNGCGYETFDTVEARLNDKVEFSNSIYASDENGNALTPNGEEYGKIVNGGYMSVKIDISGKLSDEGEGLWGIYFDLVFDNDKLEFVGALDDNGLSNSYNVSGSTLRVASTYQNGQNMPINTIDGQYLTLIFAVKSSAYEYGYESILAEQFYYKNTQVIDKDNKALSYKFLDLGETKIWMAGNLNEDGTHFGLADVNLLMNLVVSGEYDARADINWDGTVNAIDFVALKEIIMSYDFADGEIIYQDILDR